MSVIICSLVLFLLCKFLFPFLIILLKYTLGIRLFSKRKSLKSAGEWVIITGATDGIGKAYAETFAKDSFNVMLISRNLDKLNAVAEEIRLNYKVDTRVVVADFQQVDIYPKIQLEIAKLPSIACLVNNVGISYEYLARYAESKFIDFDFIRNMINCNTLSTCSMTRMVLPKMLTQSRLGAAIINVGSASSDHPSPYLSLYSGTKSMIKSFTRSLSYEISEEKVFIQCVHPIFVKTAMSKIKRSSLWIPDPKVFVENSLDMIGVERISYGYLYHALQGEFLLMLPDIVFKLMFKNHERKVRHKHKEN